MFTSTAVSLSGRRTQGHRPTSAPNTLVNPAAQVQDPGVDEDAAPDLLGLTPEEAYRDCYRRHLELDFVPASWLVKDGKVWRVIEQSPTPGTRMTSKRLRVRVSVDADGGSSGCENRDYQPRRRNPDTASRLTIAHSGPLGTLGRASVDGMTDGTEATA